MTTTRRQQDRSSLTRTMALAKAETLLLMRNRTAVANSIALPLLMVGALFAVGAFKSATSTATAAVSALAVMALCFVTYYNLVTTYVARREDLVLKRLRTGQVGDVGILTAVAAPSIVVTLVQVLVGTAALLAIGQDLSMSNPLLPLIGLLLGTVAFVVLAAASTTFTKTAETAQITTMPMIMISMALSGMFFPLSVLPDVLAEIARLLPASAVVELFNLGVAGVDRSGNVIGVGAGMTQALVPVAVLVAWTIIGVVTCSARFRWEPRS
ncbi:ABC transporter permease [Antricoccus suffuscus]|nr:ABC transporter permease [Antricoccus suffuscus]